VTGIERETMMTHVGDDTAQDAYRGAAEITVDGRDLAVVVTLRGVFHPAWGRYQWWGRVNRDDVLAAAVGARVATVTLRTSFGEVDARLGDLDMWGRYRITGTSRPPFPVRHAVDAWSDEEGD
jgi:hypothetical protein